jgi:hypothetical protein
MTKQWKDIPVKDNPILIKQLQNLNNKARSRSNGINKTTT